MANNVSKRWSSVTTSSTLGRLTAACAVGSPADADPPDSEIMMPTTAMAKRRMGYLGGIVAVGSPESNPSSRTVRSSDTGEGFCVQASHEPCPLLALSVRIGTLGRWTDTVGCTASFGTRLTRLEVLPRLDESRSQRRIRRWAVFRRIMTICLTAGILATLQVPAEAASGSDPNEAPTRLDIRSASVVQLTERKLEVTLVFWDRTPQWLLRRHAARIEMSDALPK